MFKFYLKESEAANPTVVTQKAFNLTHDLLALKHTPCPAVKPTRL